MEGASQQTPDSCDTKKQRRGISVLLFDLHIPGAHRTAEVYFNMTKCWMNGQYDGMSLAGLSLAWKT